MRIWDLLPSVLCRQHLLGEHRELHALWTIISQNRPGYRNHPETKRWDGKLPALRKRHEELVAEMKNRGYNHNSPIEDTGITGLDQQDQFVHTFEEQIDIIKNKKCECRV